ARIILGLAGGVRSTEQQCASDTLVTIADEARHMMIVTDARGRILWREGRADVLRRGERVGLVDIRPVDTANTRRRNVRLTAGRNAPARSPGGGVRGTCGLLALGHVDWRGVRDEARL